VVNTLIPEGAVLMISTIRKRDGKLVPYDNYKIANAIFKAAESVGGKDFGQALSLAKSVEEALNRKFHPNSIPAVEEIRTWWKKY
jgi:ribonucleoside-triphosphate reductase